LRNVKLVLSKYCIKNTKFLPTIHQNYMTADTKYHKTQIYFIFSINSGNSLALHTYKVPHTLPTVNTAIKTGVHARLLVFSVDYPLV